MNFKRILVFFFSFLPFLFNLLLVGEVSANTCDDKKLVILGDSLVAGFGLGPGQAYPEKLSRELKKNGWSIEVVNAGVSGDTTSGGLARLDWSVGPDAKFVLVELGANDALRGIPVERTRENLDQIITRLKARGVGVILAGMLAPPNMGAAYGEKFSRIYPELAHKHKTGLIPFFLDGVAAQTDLNQADGMHPNEKGVEIIVENTIPLIQEKLNKICHTK